jgi:hypothetical protein
MDESHTRNGLPPAPHLLSQLRPTETHSPLMAFARNVASQEGEDGIIERIFELMAPQNRYCVEFGAWDGKYLSNCYHLLENQQWYGCLIEANPRKFQDLLANHGANPKVACVNRFVELEGKNSLDQILASVGAPLNFYLLSVDVDGMDWFIWESLQAYQPNVVVIEFNPSIGNDVMFVQAKNPAVNQGCSLSALVQLGKQKGYELICCTRWNAFFVKTEFFSLFGVPSNHVDALYIPPMDGRIFHGYDSVLHVVGMPYFIWSGIQISHEDIQAVPKSMRRFSDSQT